MTFTPATKEKKSKLIRKLKLGSLNLFLYLKLVHITKFALLGMKGLSLLLGTEVYLFHLMCINVCQHVCVHTTYMPVAFGSQKVTSDHLELEFQNVVSYCLVTGN